MSNKSDYTDHEWFLLITLQPMIGSVISAIDRSGILGTYKEMTANLHAGAAAMRDYPDNELIQDIIRSDATTFREALAQSQATHKALVDRAEEKGLKDPEQFAKQVVEDCKEVAAILAEKSVPKEANTYKVWACSVGKVVAEAAAEGGILGLRGGAISEKEGELIERIQEGLRGEE